MYMINRSLVFVRFVHYLEYFRETVKLKTLLDIRTLKHIQTYTNKCVHSEKYL